MEVHTLGYDPKKRWPVNNRPRVDSRRTLVLLFGSSSFLESPDPLSELIDEYRESVVIGCSTAGEILGTQIFDESVSAAIVRFDQTDLRMASAPARSAGDSFAAGRQICPAAERFAITRHLRAV